MKMVSDDRSHRKVGYRYNKARGAFIDRLEENKESAV